MRLATLVMLEGNDRAVRARQHALDATRSLGLSAGDAERVVEGVARAVEALSARQDRLLLTIGMPMGSPPRAVAWIRSQGGAAPASDDETLISAADDVSVREMPGGFATTVLRWRVQDPGKAPSSPAVEGEATEWVLQSLSQLERMVLAERKARAETEELLGIVAHALRNPIGSMASASDLLQLSPADAGTVEAATGIISRSSRAALRLISDLEQLNQIDAGTLRLNTQELRPSLIADSALELARPLAQRRSVGLKNEREAQFQKLLVGDPDRLIQAIGNLVLAAVEHAPEGDTVTLRLRAEDGFILFEVEDRGPHVPPDAVSGLFARLRKTGPRRRAGGAFGLAAARELIEAHSGRIECASVFGGCTTMRVRLPSA